MIRRDWNHPSIILWGVRVNESPDDHDFYTRTNKVAHDLDDARQTGGVRYRYNSERLEDVFTMNDFGFPAASAESSAVPKHGIQRPYVSDETVR
jgi:beta-galactosidase